MAATVLSTEGKIPFTVGNNTFYTWYKVVGDLASATQRPVVALHGGPGFVHTYLLPMSDIADRGFPVVFYDQIGNGQSFHAGDQPDEFWTIDLFIDELENVLRHFNIEKSFDLVGHSWGAVLAAEYAIRHQPAGMTHLVLANSVVNVKTYNHAVGEFVAAMPEWVREGLTHPKTDARYRAAHRALFEAHACRADPSPPEFWYSIGQGEENPRVYDALWYVSCRAPVAPQLTARRPACAKAAIWRTIMSRTACTRSASLRWSSTAGTT
jgi:proline-specific peptidase